MYLIIVSIVYGMKSLALFVDIRFEYAVSGIIRQKFIKNVTIGNRLNGVHGLAIIVVRRLSIIRTGQIYRNSVRNVYGTMLNALSATATYGYAVNGKNRRKHIKNV